MCDYTLWVYLDNFFIIKSVPFLIYKIFTYCYIMSGVFSEAQMINDSIKLIAFKLTYLMINLINWNFKIMWKINKISRFLIRSICKESRILFSKSFKLYDKNFRRFYDWSLYKTLLMLLALITIPLIIYV